MKSAPSRPSNLAIIESCAILRPLGEDERRLFAAESSALYADRGETIWLAGEPAHSIGVIGAGFVKMTKTSPKGVETVMELLGPGQCMGLLVAIEGGAYPLTAEAVTGSWVLRIPSRLLPAVYERNAAFKDQVVRSIGPRLRKAHDMMARLSSGRVEDRLAAVLLILTESYGEPWEIGVRLTAPLTRQDLAGMAGTTVETAIRVMSRWQKEGVIATDRQVITVLREDRLGDL